MQDIAEGFNVHCTAKLGDNPGYKGTVHDDAMARRMGYRAALVPGIMVLGYIADAVVAHWGLPWLRQGTLTGRSRRGVYDGDRLRIECSRNTDASEAAGAALRISMFNEEGEEVALGSATLPQKAEAPPSLDEYPRSSFIVPPPTIAAGGFSPGDRFGSLEVLITPEFHEQCLDEFGQTWPAFRAEGLFSAVCIQKVVSRSINGSYRFATPPVFVSTAIRHFDTVHVGETLCTAGIIRQVYMRNGHHYYDAETLVTESWSRPIAMVKRSMIYAVRPTEAT